MFENIPYERPLVIGTGGGNDIVSACLVVSDLRRAGIKADLAGVLSPAAHHTFNGRQEEPINIVGGRSIRHIPSKTNPDIGFIDALVPGLLQKQCIKAKVYDVSERFGTEEAICALEMLCHERRYDGIIAVDVGGDILARGPKDPTILSPLMDFFTLYIVSQVSVPSTLLEFGLQTDGELRPEGCAQILEELEAMKILTGTTRINPKDPAVEDYKKIYHGVEGIRHGHTAAMTMQTFKARKDINTLYRFRMQVMAEKWGYEFPITLESKYFRKAFTFDLKRLAAERELAFPFKTPLEQVLRCKQIVDTKSEMDLLYVPLGDEQLPTRLWIGMLPPSVGQGQRREILSYGLTNLIGHADEAILSANDKGLIPKGWRTTCVGPYAVTGPYWEPTRSIMAIENILASPTRQSVR